MKFINVKNGEILSFLEQYKKEDRSVLPISTLRANSFYNNPKASNEDVVLVLAYKNDQLVGFIGFLPDYLQGDPTKKFAWNSGWWIDENKGRDIAIPLLLYGMKQWNNMVGFIDLPYHSFNILNTLRLIDVLGVDSGVKYVLRPYLPNSNVLQCFFSLLPGIIPSWLLNSKVDTSFSLVRELTNDMEYFIAENQKNTFAKDRNDFEWIKNFPWLSTQDNYINEQKKYPFSLVTSSFCLNYFKIEINKEVVSVGLIKERDGHYYLPFLYLNEKYIKSVLIDIVSHIIKSGGLSLYIYNSVFNEVLGETVIKYLPQKEVFQKTAFTKDFIKLWGAQINCQDGDGDAVFA
ncbi:hypothetical protein [Carboxylicivirga caseinilyticus]|uniref:hypothetical protein n=1 Tax=Carboxylicivirga caseinilyticus TaxID=3417572 RepID=UPI003D349B41|nr:hypothetical protein [Marinilabiliaceae bacterium A049]